MVFSIFLGILMLLLIILSHELGHFLAGRALGFAISEFSIGVGPKLYAWKRGETQYSLRAIPIMGYCKFVGEDEETDNPNAFVRKPVWRRIVVLLSGGLANMVFALVAAVMMFVIFGDVFNPKTAVTIAAVAPDSLAQTIGLQADDRFISMDGIPVATADEVDKIGKNLIADKGGQQTQFVVYRKSIDAEVPINFTVPQRDPQDKSPFLGINIDQIILDYPRLNLFQSTKQGFLATKNAVVVIWDAILQLPREVGHMFRQVIVEHNTEGVDVGGPIAIVSEINTYRQEMGMKMIFYYAVFIAANLGIFNLLPLPALDGGRILFAAAEGILRRPISRKAEGWIHGVGLLVFLGFAAFVAFVDILRLVN